MTALAVASFLLSLSCDMVHSDHGAFETDAPMVRKTAPAKKLVVAHGRAGCKQSVSYSSVTMGEKNRRQVLGSSIIDPQSGQTHWTKCWSDLFWTGSFLYAVHVVQWGMLQMISDTLCLRLEDALSEKLEATHRLQCSSRDTSHDP